MDALHATIRVLGLLAGIVYFVVGRKVAMRDVSPDSAVALRMFQLWWFGLASLSLVAPAMAALRLLHADSLAAVVVVVNVLLLVIVAAIAGLVYYLAYIYTGRRVILWAILGLYACLYIWLQSLLVLSAPAAWGSPGPGMDPVFLRADGQRAIQAGDPNWGLAGLALVLGPVCGAVAYFLVYFKVHDRPARYRILTVSIALTVWFGMGVVGNIFGLTQDAQGQSRPSWQLMSISISLLASLAILAAYDPPRWVRERLAITAPS